MTVKAAVVLDERPHSLDFSADRVAGAVSEPSQLPHNFATTPPWKGVVADAGCRTANYFFRITLPLIGLTGRLLSGKPS
jgi:hypothetical protein